MSRGKYGHEKVATIPACSTYLPIRQPELKMYFFFFFFCTFTNVQASEELLKRKHCVRGELLNIWCVQQGKEAAWQMYFAHSTAALGHGGASGHPEPMPWHQPL